MGVNNVNNGSPVTWIQLNEPYRRGEPVDFSKSIKDMNLDNVVLHVPKTETIYRRKEFVTDERCAEGCATCYTYIQKTLTFDDGKGGTFSWVGGGTKDCIWMTNPNGDRTFSKSGVNMNDISHAVEETWEVKERVLEKSTFSIDEVREMLANGQRLGGVFGYTDQTTSFKYASASITEGTIAYKNGAAAAYRETALSSRELYNKCTAYIGAAFGEDGSKLALSDSAYDELFGKTSGDEKSFTANAAKKRENLDKQLNRIREYMAEKLAAVRQSDPKCSSLQIFADTCLKLESFKYSDITSLVKKMFDAPNAVDTEK